MPCRSSEAAPTRSTVPQLIGASESEAERALQARQLKLGKTVERPSEEAPKGELIAQEPAPAVSVEIGSVVDITVSSGKPDVRIPEVVGRQVAEARTTLEVAGFKVSDRVDAKSTRPEGEVTRMDPPEGSVVPKGSAVTLFYSTGMIEVPDVREKTEAEARAILIEAGFKVSSIPQPTADVPPGTVISQVPDPGTRRMAGAKVSIVIAQAPEPTAPPTPTPDPTPTDPDFPDLPGPL